MSTASAVEVIHNPVCQQQLTSGSTGAIYIGLGYRYKVSCHCVKSMLFMCMIL